ADTDRPDARRGAGWCSLCDTAPRCPSCASASRHACGRCDGPRAATGRAASARRQTDAPDATHRYAASTPGRRPTSAVAGSTPTSATGRVAAPGVPATVRASNRSSFCARIADATERAGQKIILQCQLPDLGMQRLEIRTGFPFLGCRRKYLSRAFQQLGTPLPDLVRVDLELLGQLDHGLVALDR